MKHLAEYRDAVKVARDNPDREIVFLAIDFETTAPANALAVKLAKQQGLPNFSMLVSHVLVPHIRHPPQGHSPSSGKSRSQPRTPSTARCGLGSGRGYNCDRTGHAARPRESPWA